MHKVLQNGTNLARFVELLVLKTLFLLEANPSYQKNVLWHQLKMRAELSYNCSRNSLSEESWGEKDE